jgi:branched-chain amino acid transport system ATP-binding protein
MSDPHAVTAPLPAAAAALLDVRELSLAFGGLRAIDNVSTVVRAHEMVALIGPNGAGKTSLLNCINGYYKPTGGTLALNGAPIAGLAPHRMARLGISRAFQMVELIPQATVLENVMVGRHIHTGTGWLASMLFWGSAEREQIRHREAVEEILELMELDPYRSRRAGELSYGTQKLVGVARALAMEPRLLLLDEPSSGMSRQEKEDLARFLLRIRHERPLAILWVEHDTQMVKDLADRVVVLDYGRKIFDGPPEEALRDPGVVQAYLGRPVLA